MGIKFSSMEIAATSRNTSGIKGITLSENDYVVAGLPVRNSKDSLAIFSTNGLSKKISLDDLMIQKRAVKD